LLLEDFGL
jgi:hypothetical protein